MTGLLDAYGTEVHGDDVEGGVGGALEHATQTAGETVGAKGLHGVDHHAAGTTTAERFHDGGGEGGYNVVSNAEYAQQPGNTVHQKIHSSTGSEYGDTNENGDQVRDDHHCGMESVLGSFYKCFVGLNLAIAGEAQECNDNTEQGKTTNQKTGGADGFCSQVAEVNHDGNNASGKTAQPGDGNGILQLYLLEKTEGNDACDSAKECGKQ